MIDYQLKSTLINSPLFLEYKKIQKSKQFYIRHFNIPYEMTLKRYFNLYDFHTQAELRSTYTEEIKKNNMYPLDKALELELFYCNSQPIEWKECQRIYNSHINRVGRLKKRIENIVKNDSLFLTLTFTDKCLDKTSANYRKDCVKKFLTSLEVPYVANIDFGKENGREHYHAVVQLDRVDHTLWKHGAINFQKIRNNTEDTERIAKYVAKLVNHAIKETTKRCAIMYSKKFK